MYKNRELIEKRYSNRKDKRNTSPFILMNPVPILVSLAFCLSACDENATEVKSTHNTIPFVLTDHNNISIEAVINQKDTLNLMFHTAANSLDLTEETTKKISSINWDTETEVNTWGGKATSRSSANNTLEIKAFKWDSLRIWENKNSGPETDGKFGPNLFGDKAIEINYDESEIVIHDSTPAHADSFESIPITTENAMMFMGCLSTINEDEYPNQFLIHSGFGGTILYDDDFVAESRIGERIEITSEQELQDSHGNILRTKKGKIPHFSIGGTNFESVPVGFFGGAIGGQKISMLGGDLLKRFNIIIDSKREFVYLKSNQLSKLPFTKLEPKE